jgi:cell division septal protein FtsQ
MNMPAKQRKAKKREEKLKRRERQSAVSGSDIAEKRRQGKIQLLIVGAIAFLGAAAIFFSLS